MRGPPHCTYFLNKSYFQTGFDIGNMFIEVKQKDQFMLVFTSIRNKFKKVLKFKCKVVIKMIRSDEI
jgi:hypothetical protein